MVELDRFGKALGNLHHAAAASIDDPVIELAATANLFQICFEQAWKAMKAVLEAHGYAEAAVGSPLQIIKLAFQKGLIRDEHVWREMLSARRIAAHTYDESAGTLIIDRLPVWLEKFDALQHELSIWAEDAALVCLKESDAKAPYPGA